MQLTKYKCDVCGRESNGGTIGYAWTHSNDASILDYSFKKPEEYKDHACSLTCITKVFNSKLSEQLSTGMPNANQ